MALSGLSRRCACPAEGPLSRLSETGGRAGRQSLKVFVIEDDVVLRRLILEALREIPGVDVLFYVDNEVSATNWLSSNDGAWDLAVVDLYLKQGSGVGTLSW